MKSLHISLYLMLLSLLAVVSPTVTAQVDSELRIAFVSNRAGNEDIWIMSQTGEDDLRANLTNNPARDWSPAWSPDGAQIIFNSDRDGRDTLYIMDADGRNVQALFPGEAFNDYDARWSPDGNRILFVSDRSGVGRDIYVVNADGSGLEAITSTGTIKGNPVWSADGASIAFWERLTGGVIVLFRLNLDSGAVQRLTTDGPADGMPVWSPVDDYIYFDTNRENGVWSLYRIEPNGNFPERVTDAGVNSGRASLSPDGSQLAYVTDRDESDEIYVRDLRRDDITPRRLTDNRFSDHSPAWQPAVPEVEIALQTTPEPVEEPEDDAASIPLVGQSVSGVETVLIPAERLKIDYGISAWQQSGWTGAGQRIGVIDTQFGDIQTFDITTTDVILPPEDLISDYTISTDTHGTDVLRVIHTVAPNAQLYACRYEGTIEELTACRDWMINNNVRVINHSVGRPVLPLNGEHEWARLVDDTFAQDVLWVNSAGNFNQGYITDNYQGDDEGYHQFIFGNERQSIIVPVEGYSGEILLSWLEDEQTRQIVNFDLELVGLISGNVLNPDTGRIDQMTEPASSNFEQVSLFNIEEPFEIRVLNAGQPLDRPIRFDLFVEFADLEFSSEIGSLVAPADARYALSVGAVNGNNEVAAYSSRGTIRDNYSKPDILAPGEILIGENDSDIFIGTSAAAPVVAGIAALLLEADTTLQIDELRDELVNTWRGDESLVFEAGIVRLGVPERTRRAGNIIEIPAKTVFPQPDELFVDQGYECPGAIPSRLEVGIPGYVNFNLGLAIRQSPGLGGAQLDTLDTGMQFTVIGGPECADGLNWWEVELVTGAIGWLAEGSPYYLIAPINLGRAELPVEYNTSCPNALATQLEIGERGVINRGGLFFFRAEGARFQMSQPSGDSVVHILGGPVCEGATENVLRWYVRIIEGRMVGYEGWIAEGDTDTRLIDPQRQN